MAPGLPRNHSSRSPLIRLLQDHAADGPEARFTFAERLSQWLGWTDAIALSGVLNGNAPPLAVATGGRPMPAKALLEEFERVRAELARAIHADTILAPRPPAPAPTSPRSRRRPSTRPEHVDGMAQPPEDPADFTPCRRQLQAHQRAMTERVAALRADVRLTLASHSAALARLAALDAVMDDALAAREKHVLSLVPALLEQRFHQRRRGQAAAAEAAAAAANDDAAGSPEGPPPWRIASGQEMQDVLLAELDLRLQPVQGMVDALAQDITRQ